MITVAAILPVYNVKKYLSRCLDSVLAQTRPFDQVIIVNDGSTDGCKDICTKYEKNNDSITLVHKENGGLVSAWMEGIKHVSTDYICFIDSDDYVAKDYLEAFVKELNDDIDMVCMNATQSFDTGEERKFRINGLNAGTYVVDEKLKCRILSDHGAFIRPIASCRWGKMIRTGLVLEYAKFCSKDISYGEDQQLTLGVLLGCRKIQILDEYKYYYQYNTTSIVHTYKKDLWEKIELLMDVISNIPGMQNIPEFQRQFNTQYLLYFSECLRNESYNGSLTRKTYKNLLNTQSIQKALKDYYSEKLRKIDKIIIKNAKKNKYFATKLILELYKKIYWLRGIPG